MNQGGYGGTVTLERIDCPGCGAGVDIAKSVGRGQIVCGSCNSVLDAASPEYRIIQQLVGGDFEPRSSIRIGWEGTFLGKIYRVVGRLRYVDVAKGWFWEEWFLIASDGSVIYLEEDEAQFKVLVPFTPTAPPAKETLTGSHTFRLDGRPYHVRERGKAVIKHFEGQLPWKVKIDTEVDFVDAAAGRYDEIAVEFTKRELEFYRGEAMSHRSVAQSFGTPTVFPKGLPGDDADDYQAAGVFDGDSSGEMSGSGVAVMIVIIVILVILAFTMDDCGGCVIIGGGGGHYGGGGGFGK